MNQMNIFQSSNTNQTRSSFNYGDLSRNNLGRNDRRFMAATDNLKRMPRSSGSRTASRHGSSLKSVHSSGLGKADSSLYADEDARYQVDIKQPTIHEFPTDYDRWASQPFITIATRNTTTDNRNQSTHNQEPEEPRINFNPPPPVNMITKKIKSTLGRQINSILEEIEVQKDELSKRAVSFGMHTK